MGGHPSARLQQHRQGQSHYDRRRGDVLFAPGNVPGNSGRVAIYGLYADPAAISRNLDSLSGLLPGGAIDVIRDQMTRIASRDKSTLGLAFAIGLLVSLWSANAGIKSLFDSLNLVYDA